MLAQSAYRQALGHCATNGVGPEALVAGSRGGIVPDGLLHDVPLPQRQGLQRAAQRFLVDFKMLHLGAHRYTTPRVADREVRAAAVAYRERAVDVMYAAHARRLDEDHHGVSAAAVSAGTAPPGPVLACLRSYPPVAGLVFGGYAEGSPAVHALHGEAVRRAAEGWRGLGSRSRAEARSVLAHMFARDWGLVAARAAARLRLSRAGFVGLSRERVEASRAADRVAMRPAVDPAAVRHGAPVERMDAAAGASLHALEYGGARRG